MTVRELIEYLETLPGEAKVFAVTETIYQECDYEPISWEIMRFYCKEDGPFLYIGLI